MGRDARARPRSVRSNLKSYHSTPAPGRRVSHAPERGGRPRCGTTLRERVSDADWLAERRAPISPNAVPRAARMRDEPLTVADRADAAAALQSPCSAGARCAVAAIVIFAMTIRVCIGCARGVLLPAPMYMAIRLYALGTAQNGRQLLHSACRACVCARRGKDWLYVLLLSPSIELFLSRHASQSVNVE